MGWQRLHRITLGVPDVAASSAFYRAFGLTETAPGRFGSRDGGDQLALVERPRRGLAHLTLAVDDPDDLGRVAARLANIGVDATVTDDRLDTIEPATRIPIAVVVAAHTPPAPHEPTVPNSPGRVTRWNQPAEAVLRREPVRPSRLSHLVLVTPDFATTLGFLLDGLGYEVSDQVPGVIAFTRGSDQHHDLAVQAGPGTMVHHVAWEVDDVDEVARGGATMVEADADRQVWGLGRHAIGSNWFWYLREPSGHYVEYTADMDAVTEAAAYRPAAWQGHEFLYAYGPPVPPIFLEPADAAELLAGDGGVRP